MTPVSPVLTEEFAPAERIAGGEGYLDLPMLMNSTGVILSRWKLTDEERKAVAEGADVLLSVWTFGQPLQPLRIEIGGCDRSILEIAEHMGLA